MHLPIDHWQESLAAWRSSWSYPTTNTDVASTLCNFLLACFESISSTIMLWKSKALLVVSFLFAHTSISSNSSMGSTYLLGVGIGDVTGPIVETNSQSALVFLSVSSAAKHAFVTSDGIRRSCANGYGPPHETAQPRLYHCGCC